MKLTAIHTGFFKLDGGAMFGIVPKRLWSRLHTPDTDNLCSWSMRALLIQTGTRNILIDTGLGDKQDDKFRAHFLPHGAESLYSSLAQAGVTPEAITDVLLTHLHFDHCGGALRLHPETGEIIPTFPNAVYWSNQKHWDWAMYPNEREKASFLKENFVPLANRGQVRMLEVRQGISFAEGIKIRFSYGHTEAMMLPIIEAGGKTLIYCADLLPSQWHIGMPYIMAYDIRPLRSLQEKGKLLAQAARKGHILFFEHDPFVECATVRQDEKGRTVAAQTGQLSDFFA